jgi:holliday junction DNA helicase RuvB
MQNPELDPHKIDHDEHSAEISLRPKSFQNFIGQNSLKENLAIFINAAKKRSESLDHVLLYGPPGLGKTTIAQIIAYELGTNIKITSGPVITKSGDLAAILTNLQAGDVLFIDEIHRLNTNVEEILYSAMEDFALDIMIGEGAGARSVRIDLPRFTLVGATTRTGLLSNPLRDRFGIPMRIDFYSGTELAEIVTRSSKLLNSSITKQGALEIGNRARGTPRIAIRLFKRVRDFASHQNANIIDEHIANNALNNLEIDNIGLDSNDHKYLRLIIENFNGGPVGIETIAASMSEQKDTIEEIIEPYLLQLGFMQKTSRGRVLTLQSFTHMGYDPINNKNTNIEFSFDE